MRCLNRLLAVALTLASTCLHSQAQWEIEDSHTTASLRGIHNVGGGVAWASGTNGTVLRTEDGGYLWQTCSIPPGAEKLDFRGIQAFDENTAIVMSSGTGDLSRLYMTTDGCQTWKLLFTNPDKDGFWDAISFTRSPNGKIGGWILGDPTGGRFRVFSTSDADGMAFAADNSPSLNADAKTAGAFAASNSSFFILQNSPPLPHQPSSRSSTPSTPQSNAKAIEQSSMVYFVTGGKQGARVFVHPPGWLHELTASEQWTSLPLPLGPGSEASGAFSIVLRNYQAGVVVGGEYTQPQVSERTAAYRDSKTESWQPAQTPPHGFRSAVAYDSNTKTWITVGPNGTDISTDDGRNWHPLTPTPQDAPDADKNWNALSLPFVVGPKGRIGRLRATALPTPHAAKE